MSTVSTMQNFQMLILLLGKAITRLWNVQLKIRQHKLRSGVNWQGAVCTPESYVTFHYSVPWKHQFLRSPSISLSTTFFHLRESLTPYNCVLFENQRFLTYSKNSYRSITMFTRAHHQYVTSTMPRPFKRYLSFVFSHQKPVHISPFCPRQYMPRPFRPPSVCYPNNIWWKVHMMKLLITKLSPVSCYLLLLGPNYSPERPVL